MLFKEHTLEAKIKLAPARAKYECINAHGCFEPPFWIEIHCSEYGSYEIVHFDERIKV